MARELPVLLRGRDHEPFTRGIADLVYDDDHHGAQLVVADFKTDWIRADGDDQTLLGHALGYRDQLMSYAEAIAAALSLERPPRAELWFFAADRIVALDTEGNEPFARIDSRTVAPP